MFSLVLQGPLPQTSGQGTWLVTGQRYRRLWATRGHTDGAPSTGNMMPQPSETWDAAEDAVEEKMQAGGGAVRVKPQYKLRPFPFTELWGIGGCGSEMCTVCQSLRNRLSCLKHDGTHVGMEPTAPVDAVPRGCHSDTGNQTRLHKAFKASCSLGCFLLPHPFLSPLDCHLWHIAPGPASSNLPPTTQLYFLYGFYHHQECCLSVVFLTKMPTQDVRDCL